MNAIKTLTASTKPPTVEMNSVALDLHNEISRCVKLRRVKPRSDPKPQKNDKCSNEECTRSRKGGCQGMCKQCFEATGGTAPNYKKCLIEGCEKDRQSKCERMCKQCFRHITGKKAPSQHQKIECLIEGCEKHKQYKCEGKCKQCFRDTKSKK